MYMCLIAQIRLFVFGTSKYLHAQLIKSLIALLKLLLIITFNSDRTISILYYRHRRTKKVENTSTLYHPGCGSQVQAGTENWHRKLTRGFKFVPIPCLIFPEWKPAL